MEEILTLLEAQLDFLKMRKMASRECPFTVASVKEDETQNKYIL